MLVFGKCAGGRHWLGNEVLRWFHGFGNRYFVYVVIYLKSSYVFSQRQKLLDGDVFWSFGTANLLLIVPFG